MPKFNHPELIELSNGIPVILQHYEGSVATTYWWNQVGSADEKPSQAGFAHFLEHMLFKDAAAKETGKASTGQMARAIESLGGDINAYTSFDQTVYHVTCAAQHWERVLDVFGKMAKPQKFLKEDFEREREVILEELRKNEDSPGRQLFQALFSSTFSKHPYGRPVIGFVRTLQAATVAELEKFYRNYYISGNMGLILVGPLQNQRDARKKAIIKNLEKHFGAKVLRRTEKKKPSRPVEPATRARSGWEIKPFDVKTPTISFSFRVPGLAHEDLPALDLLSNILGTGELSRMYQRLFYQTSLVTDISGGLYVSKDPGMLYFQAEVDSIEKINKTVEEMLRELKKIGEEGPTSEEIARVLASAESERLYATQTVDGMAGRLGFLQFTMGDLRFDQEYLDELHSVDVFKIKEVAKKYFDDRRLNGVLLMPKSEVAFDLTEIEKVSADILHPPAESRLPVPVRPDHSVDQPKATKKAVSSGVERIVLPSGMQFCFYPRPQSHVVSVHAAVLGGLRLEIVHPIERAETDWGSSYMMAMTWTKGTSKRDARKISDIVEGRAASLDGFSGRNSIGLQMTGLARDWGTLSDLFAEVLVDPAFPKDEVDHARRIAEDSVRSVEDHSGQLCSKLFLETLFESHPYGRMTHGSLESLAKIQPEKLRAFHRGWVRPERLVVSISGALKKASLEDWIHQLDHRLQVTSRSVIPFDFPQHLAEETPLRANRWVERSLKREQSHILVGGLGTCIDAGDRNALRILQTLLGGQSGRLFIELREKKSLAYTVSTVSFEGIEKGYVGTYIACSPQKREEAIAGMRTVLEKLVEKGPTPQEMKRAKEYFMGRRAMDLQSDVALASHYGLESLYRVPLLSEAQLAKKIEMISAREIQKVCKKYFVDPCTVTAVVG